MKTNEGVPDRAVRIVIGLLALVAAFVWLGAEDGSAVGIIAAFIGLVLIGTGVVGFCPLYRIIGLNTCSVCRDRQRSADGGS